MRPMSQDRVIRTVGSIDERTTQGPDMDQYRTLAIALDRTTEKDLRRTRPPRPDDAIRRRQRLAPFGR
jgi:hypothetical protein